MLAPAFGATSRIRTSTFAACIGAWIVASLVLTYGFADGAPQTASDSDLERALLDATNVARREHGLEPLVWDEGLARVARLHAAENGERNVLDHGSPDPLRDTPAKRIGAGEVALVEIGENLAWMPGDDVARRSVEGWLGSPPHRRNLLDPDFTHVGFGTARGGEGTYVAQLFGVRPWSRLSASVTPFERTSTRMDVQVEGPAGVGGALFAGGVALVTFAFTGTSQTLSVDAPRLPGRFELAGLVSEGRYRAVHAFDVDESGTVTLAPVSDAPAWVVGAEIVDVTVEGFTASIAYEVPDPAWAVLVDGVHRPDAAVEGAALSVDLVDPDGPVEIAVGAFTSSSSIRVLERFTLMPVAGVVVPGRPPDDVLESERTAWSARRDLDDRGPMSDEAGSP